MKPYNKYTQWLETIFGRESSATQHRRLLQHDDDDDGDQGATEDYEEQTKEPWEREKRTADLKSLEIYVKTERNFVPEANHPTSKISKISNFKPSTPPLYNDEINFLIDAAMKMKSDYPHGQRIKLKSNGESITEKDSFLKRLGLKMFSKNVRPEIKNIETTKTSNTIDEIPNSTFKIETTTSRIKSTPKMTQKHKERNFIFSGHRRSLKSIEIGESNDEIAPSTSDIKAYVNNTAQLQYNEEKNIKYISDTIESKYEPNNATNKTNNKTIVSIAREQEDFKVNEGTYKHNNSTWGLGEIFSMLADLCMFLAGFDVNQEDNGYRFLYDFVTMLNPNYLRKNKTLSEKVINDTRHVEASIGSERVENIGHRSRVLLSFEEPAENVTSMTSEKDVNESYVVTSKK
ncbi:uncharacterized protein LOC133532190 [Cydia pomonella]|uniref:uncharacterized protein LOC133532190 n=1 Tax=Cydia pomonella TaxID=82600 RepID=UPI002ADD3D16|nr:uncharacterized protein LOC133532190 [Cydia pomonella]